MAWSTWPVGAQQTAKKPLGYDVYDYWKSIGGSRLSDDGQWFAYSLTSQAEDPELIVRNIASGQEFKQPRGTGPQFTPDGKFLIFTIPPPRSETESAGASRRRRRRRRLARQPAKDRPRRRTATRSGIMSLPERAGDDRGANRELPSADGIVHVGGPAEGPRRWRRRARRAAVAAGAAVAGVRAAVAASRRAAGGRTGPGGGRGGAAHGAPQREDEARRQRSDRPQSHDRTGRDDSGSDRVRVGQDGRVAALCRVVHRRGEGRRVRAEDDATGPCARCTPARDATRASRSTTRMHAGRCS